MAKLFAVHPLIKAQQKLFPAIYVFPFECEPLDEPLKYASLNYDMTSSQLAIFCSGILIAIAAVAWSLFLSNPPNPQITYYYPDGTACNQSATATLCRDLVEFASRPASHPILLTGTSTYTSDVLGIAFDYPASWGTATTTYTPADPQSPKGYAGAQYHLGFTGGQVLSPSGQILLPDISVDDYGSSHYAYEGPSNLIEYWGQPIQNICATKSFLNKSFDNSTVEKCEYHTNAYGVSYAWVRVSGNFPPYGFLEPPIAYAASTPDLTLEGFIVPTKSALDPGMTVSERFSANGYGNMNDNEANTALLPKVKAFVESLRYIR